MDGPYCTFASARLQYETFGPWVIRERQLYSPREAFPAMLLHIGNTATSWTTLDPYVFAVGFALFLVLAAIIWLPARLPRAARRALRAVAGPAAAVGVALAILPSVLPYDHLLPTAHAEAQEEVHTTHCHINPGSCSDAPLSAGAGQFLMGEPLVVTPVLLAFLIVVSAPVLIGRNPLPALRPPLFAAA
ncbi:MAG: hypothetical protein HY873_06730 [Chloroflexi bacterium]|nr:hypothetical protein [Chloroflexota bacterium]